MCGHPRKRTEEEKKKEFCRPNLDGKRGCMQCNAPTLKYFRMTKGEIEFVSMYVGPKV